MKYPLLFLKPATITFVTFCVTVTLLNKYFAQENSEKEEVFRTHHQLGVVLSHAHVF